MVYRAARTFTLSMTPFSSYGHHTSSNCFPASAIKCIYQLHLEHLLAEIALGASEKRMLSRFQDDIFNSQFLFDIEYEIILIDSYESMHDPSLVCEYWCNFTFTDLQHQVYFVAVARRWLRKVFDNISNLQVCHWRPTRRSLRVAAPPPSAEIIRLEQKNISLPRIALFLLSVTVSIATITPESMNRFSLL